MLTNLRHRLRASASTVPLILTAGTLLFGLQYFGFETLNISTWHFPWPKNSNSPNSANNGGVPKATDLLKGNPTLLAEAPRYINAIMDPEDDSFPRLTCPPINTTRYGQWRDIMDKYDRQPKSKKFFFALNLHQSAAILPRLLGSIIEVVRFLGPNRCALSIIEGRSTDGTFEILQTLRPALEDIGLEYYFDSSDINPHGDSIDRVEAMAELRNLAVRPLIAHMWAYNERTTAILLDDVAACPDDILELMYQRNIQNIWVTCSMDWAYSNKDEVPGGEPTFHDVWAARDVTGEPFYRISEDGNLENAGDLLWNDPESQTLLQAGKWFQVFSCWSGAMVVDASEFTYGQMRFRTHHEDECVQPETLLFCKDLWARGNGQRIAIIPSVNLAYSDEQAAMIKGAKGYVQNWMSSEERDDRYGLVYHRGPPQLLRCMSGESR